MNKKELEKIARRCERCINSTLDILFLVNNEIVKNHGLPVDKKMHQVTKRMETAQKDIKKGEPKAAEKVLKKAEKKNEKLVKIDREVRDPMIKKCKKMMHSKKK